MKRSHHPVDALFLGVLLAVLGVILFPGGKASFALQAAQPFPDPYLATAQAGPLEPSPEVYQRLGRMGRIVVGQYVARPGDTLASVAKTFGTTPTSLRSTNRLESPALTPGKTLLVHPGEGMIHQVQEVKGAAEDLSRIAERYNQAPERIARANRLPGVALLSSRWLQAGDLLFIPRARLRFSEYDFPVSWVRGKRFISSGFGVRRHPVYRHRSFHKGWDMPRPHGFPVKASRDGRVVFAGWRTGYGRLVILKHSGGIRTWYGHLSKVTVTPGQMVKKGQVVGKVGSTGIATGPHLHFEVRDRYGNSLNPKKFLF